MTDKLQTIHVDSVYDPTLEIEVVTDIRLVPQINGDLHLIIEKKRLRIPWAIIVEEGK